MSNTQILPPKMLQQYADLAKAGKADRSLGSGVFEFYRGNQVICVIGIDPPCIGHVKKVTTTEMERLRAEIARSIAQPAQALNQEADR